MDDDSVLSYKRGVLVYRSSEKCFKMRMPLPFIKRVLVLFRLGERFLRITPKCTLKLNDNVFLLSFNGFVYNLDIETITLTKEHRYCPMMNNPCSIVSVDSIEGFENGVIYGEYPINPSRNPISIYQRNNDGNWINKYTFNGNILHIHNIVPDRNRGCIYILTGDTDEESGIWEARNDFKDVKPIVIGSQLYRSCVAFPVKNGLLYATDSPLEQNYICYLNFSTKKIEKIIEISGACTYGIQKKDNFYFVADVEPDATLKGLRYWTTYRLGKGIKDRRVRIVCGNIENGFSVIYEFKKDVWPYTLFQFGNVIFPQSLGDKVLACPVAVKRYDGKTIFLNNNK